MKKTTTFINNPGVQPTSMLKKAGIFLPGVMLCLSSLFISSGTQAQISLPASPAISYTETFNSMGSSTTLPAGWSIRTGATASSEGTSGGNFFSATGYTGTTGGFYNLPSYPGSSTTNRALGLRQSGSFGDPGASMQLDLANTTGRISFSLSINHQMTIVATRSTVFNIEYSTNGGTAWTAVGTYADPGVTGAVTQSYTFGSALDNLSTGVKIRVLALGSTGGGSRDQIAIDDFVLTWAYACSAPTGLAANNIGTTSADLNWNGISGVNGYEYTIDQTAANPSLTGTAITTNSYAATGLTPSTVYYMHLRTDCGSSTLSSWTTYSFTTLTPCGTISGLTANNIFTTSADLNWNTVGGITNYEYVLDQVSGDPAAAGTAITTNSYAATALTPSTVYYMHVRTNCGPNNLSAWNTYSFTTLTPCGNITGLTANNIGTMSADLNWNSVSGIVDYEYVLDQNASAPSTAGTAITTNSYAATGLTPTTVYYMHVRTDCGSNNLSAWNTYSFTTLTPCGNITGLTANNIFTTSADLSWNVVTGVNNYEYVLDQNATAPTAAGTATTTNAYSATGLTPTTVYYIHVRTDCGSNNLSAWNTYSFTTLTPCGTITGLTGNNITLSTADLIWDSIPNILNYEYTLDQNPSAPTVAGTATSSFTYAATGLSSGTVYYMHVRTDCGGGNTSVWATYSFTTAAPCGGVTGINASNVTTTSADLNWNAVSGILNYEYVLDQTATAPGAAGTAITTNSYAATSLAPGNTYYIHVRTNCGSGNTSAWTTYSFTTVSNCPSPANLTASGITSNSAHLSWNSGGSASFDYVIDQSPAAPSSNGTSISATTYTATSLTAGTTYYLHVRANCGSGNLSGWITISFTTNSTSTGINDASALSSRILIFPNPASDRLNIQTDEQLNNSMITVSDISGKILMSVQATSSLTVINTQDLSAGVYFLNIQTTAGQMNSRFIKN